MQGIDVCNYCGARVNLDGEERCASVYDVDNHRNIYMCDTCRAATQRANRHARVVIYQEPSRGKENPSEKS